VKLSDQKRPSGAIRKEHPDDCQRFRAQSLMGTCLTGQKKYAEAGPLLMKGIRGWSCRKTGSMSWSAVSWTTAGTGLFNSITSGVRRSLTCNAELSFILYAYSLFGFTTLSVTSIGPPAPSDGASSMAFRLA